MSATNRGAKRREADFYATPEGALKPLLPYLSAMPRIWEPACGDGRLVRWLCVAGLEAAGSDLNAGYDFLKDDGHCKTILTNPPFSLALEFCDHADFLSIAEATFGRAEMKQHGGLWRTLWREDSRYLTSCLLETRTTKRDNPKVIKSTWAAYCMDLWKKQRLGERKAAR